MRNVGTMHDHDTDQDDDALGLRAMADAGMKVFLPAYQAPPEAVATIFATLAMQEERVDADGLFTEVGEVFGETCLDDLIASLPAVDGEDVEGLTTYDRKRLRLDRLLLHAGLAGFIAWTEHCEEGRSLPAWHEYAMRSERDRAAMILLGARRWIEKHLPKDQIPIARPIEVDEMEKLLACNPIAGSVCSVAHVLAILEPLAGTGEAPRPCDKDAAVDAALRQMSREHHDLKRRAERAETALSTINEVLVNHAMERAL
jgi:hypothetical protein